MVEEQVIVILQNQGPGPQGDVNDVTKSLLWVVNVLDILIYQVEETYLDCIVDYREQEEDNEDDIGSISQVFNRLWNEFFVYGQSKNI